MKRLTFHRGVRRWLTVVGSVLIGLAGLVASPAGQAWAGAGGAGPGCGSAQPGAGRAAAAAVVCGHRVEIADRRTAVSAQFANPDGTLTLESSSIPWSVWAYANSRNLTSPTDAVRVGWSADNSAVHRAFWQFPIADLAGATIVDASFQARLTHSWSCADTPVNLYAVGAIANPGKVAWSPPLLGAPLSERWGRANKSGACGVQPDMWLTFTDSLASHVQSLASAGAAALNVGLSARRWDASGENTVSYWKKFDPASVHVTVTFTPAP